MNGLTTEATHPVPLIAVTASDWPGLRERLPEAQRNWLQAQGFTGKAEQCVLLPDPIGTLAAVVVGIESVDDPWALAALPTRLPVGSYALDGRRSTRKFNTCCEGSALGRGRQWQRHR